MKRLVILLAACDGGKIVHDAMLPIDAAGGDAGDGDVDAPLATPIKIADSPGEPKDIILVDGNAWWTVNKPVPADPQAPGESGVAYQNQGGQGYISSGTYYMGELVRDGDDVFVEANYQIQHLFVSQHGSQLPSRVFDGAAVGIDRDHIVIGSRTRPGPVYVCPRTGCDPEPMQLAANQAFPDTVRVYAGTAYWIGGDAQSYQIYACAVDGCGMVPQALSATITSGATFEVDTSGLYTYNYGRIMRCSAAGCTSTPEMIGQITNVTGNTTGFALDETYAYGAYGDTIARVRKDCVVGTSCTLETIARMPDVGPLAVDGNFVYFATKDAIYKLPK